ncbi:MAG: hydrogenase maturation protease [Thermoplasmata archaeon]|nr:hydrogenase maturation protease [Thermoplasmata archaeon]
MHKLCDSPCESEESLSAELARLAGHRKVYVLGIGNKDRGDDGAGIAVAEELQKTFPSYSHSEHDGLEGIVLDLSERDEDAFVVFVDAADLREKPGTTRLVEMEEIRATEITTHRVTVALLAALLGRSGKHSAVLCIQPGSIEFQAEMTAPVRTAVDSVVKVMSGLMERSAP